jgi:hypothetical protein
MNTRMNISGALVECYCLGKTEVLWEYKFVHHKCYVDWPRIEPGPQRSSFLDAFRKNCEEWLLALSCLSVCLFLWNKSAPIGRIFFKCVIFEYFSKNHKENSRKLGTLHEDQYTFLIISRSVRLRMQNVSHKICRENQNTHFMLSDSYFRKTYRLWDNGGKIL